MLYLLCMQAKMQLDKGAGLSRFWPAGRAAEPARQHRSGAGWGGQGDRICSLLLVSPVIASILEVVLRVGLQWHQPRKCFSCRTASHSVEQRLMPRSQLPISS